MHLIVILLGLTGVLGKLITTGSTVLVWYRMLIAFLFLIAYIYFKTDSLKVSKKHFIEIFGIGCIVAAHWLFFFESIKVSNVSVAVVCMGTSSLFSSLLEPLIIKRKISLREIILGFLVLIAIGIAMNADFSFFLGFIFVCIYMLFSSSFTFQSLIIDWYDFLYLIILGGLCTSFAFVVSVEVMKFLSPFNVIMAVNLEPVYSILLALVLFGESENMNFSFYVGAIVIIGTVFLDGYFKIKNL